MLEKELRRTAMARLCGEIAETGDVMFELEICVDSVESALAAQAGGAQRVELCGAISEGGLTPSLGMIGAVRERIGIGVFVMIRPRCGDFVYTEEEWRVMRRDVALAGGAGADGVVLGILQQDGRIDIERTRALVEEAAPMHVTFHRAFDVTPNLEEGLDGVMATGAHRILTSGGAENATEGSVCVRSLVQRANCQVRIMIGGHVRPENVGAIAEATGAREFHASLRVPVASPVTWRHPSLRLGHTGCEDDVRYQVFADDVRQLREAIDRQGMRQGPGTREHGAGSRE
jgi:copper homeostasis protein